MIKIVSNDQMREMDQKTINDLGVPGLILMENAGRQTFDYIHEFIIERNLVGPIDVYCGKGNNGGDGYVIARHLFNHGFYTRIVSVGSPKELDGDAKINYQICEHYQIPIHVVQTKSDLGHSDSPALIVDALLGTGIKGVVRGLFKSVIEYINQLHVAVISVDIPSGLNGDLPIVNEPVIRADMTVTMALPKRAHLFYPSKKYVGQLEIADISMPEFIQDSPEISLNLVDSFDISIPPLPADTYKYASGKLFILAGSPGMTGAATLAASAALRSGVGLINVGIPVSLNPIMEIKLTEALTVPLAETKSGCLSLNSLARIEERISWADAVIIGPGCGRESETIEVLVKSIQICMDKNIPTLIDADGLFALSENKQLLKSLSANTILTPHYGEFRRLTTFSQEKINQTPWQCLEDFLSDKKYIVNLKGAPSMVGATDGQMYVNPTGNAGLAKGGSGDVLAGIIGGLLARGGDPVQAAITGNYLLGEAADVLQAETGNTTIIPTDLLDILPELFDNRRR